LAPNHIRVVLGESFDASDIQSTSNYYGSTSLPTTTAAVDNLGYETSTMPTPEVGRAVKGPAGGGIPCVN
jgi:hypothetical protein